MFQNKKIYIMGMARSGYEAAKLLANYNNKILITDGKEQDPEQVHELENLGVQVIITDDQASYLDDSFDFVIKNPGIRYDSDCILKAESLKIPVINEVEMAYHFLPKDVTIVAITGSNGKTTTSTLTYEMLRKSQRKAYLGGNIGYPLSSFIGKIESGDILVLEVSAQQLHDMYKFKADYAVLTNLSEAHLEFFGTYENYIGHKKRIFQNQTSEDIAIINVGDSDSVSLTGDIVSTKIGFSSKVETDLCIREGYICYKNEKIVSLNDIRIQGNHNYENIMCAIAVAKENGVDNDTICEVLNNFVGVEHRIEFVRKINGREFYNDSKATNVKSTQIALKSFSKPTILLLGGYERNHSFDELEEYMENVKCIVCFGATKYRILEFANRIGKNCEVVDTLSEAVKVAYHFSQEGDVILLSPACASWDQYKCFEDRGNEFKTIVESLD